MNRLNVETWAMWLNMGVGLAASAWTWHLVSASDAPVSPFIFDGRGGLIFVALPNLGAGLLALAWKRSWVASLLLLGMTTLAAGFLVWGWTDLLGFAIDEIRAGRPRPDLELAPLGMIYLQVGWGLIVLALLVGTIPVKLAVRHLTQQGKEPSPRRARDGES